MIRCIDSIKLNKNDLFHEFKTVVFSFVIVVFFGLINYFFVILYDFDFISNLFSILILFVLAIYIGLKYNQKGEHVTNVKEVVTCLFLLVIISFLIYVGLAYLFFYLELYNSASASIEYSIFSGFLLTSWMRIFVIFIRKEKLTTSFVFIYSIILSFLSFLFPLSIFLSYICILYSLNRYSKILKTGLKI